MSSITAQLVLLSKMARRLCAATCDQLPYNMLIRTTVASITLISIYFFRLRVPEVSSTPSLDIAVVIGQTLLVLHEYRPPNNWWVADFSSLSTVRPSSMIVTLRDVFLVKQSTDDSLPTAWLIVVLVHTLANARSGPHTVSDFSSSTFAAAALKQFWSTTFCACLVLH